MGQLIEHSHLPVNQVKVVFVNGIVRKEEHTLDEGDKVGVFPPVGEG